MDTASEKKQHLSFLKQISLLRGYVKSGISEEGICDTMKITASQFKTLYFYLGSVCIDGISAPTADFCREFGFTHFPGNWP